MGKLQTRLVAAAMFAVLLTSISPFTTQAQLSGPLQPNTDQTELPKYNQGVDTSIKEFLCAPSDIPSEQATALYDCIGRLYRFGLTSGAVLLVFFFVIAGYLYITGGEGGKGKAKSIIFSSLTGMAILLGSYALLNFINPDLVKIKIIQPPIFQSADLPSCEAVGFGTKCITAGGQVSTPPGGGGSYGGKSCTPITNNASPASVDNLTNSCFGQYGNSVVRQASIVASSESGGNPSLPVSAGSCGAGKRPARCTGGEIPVWGLYQINITAHKVGGLDCPAAFGNKAWTCSTSCTVIDKDLYNRCVTAAKNATENINVACRLYGANKTAGRPGFNDWGNTANEHGKRCGF